MCDSLQCSSIAGWVLLAADGELNPDQWSRLEEHLAYCTHCKIQAENIGFFDRRLLESRSALSAMVPPTEVRASELIRQKILSRHETWLERLLLSLRPIPTLRVAVVLGLALVVALNVLKRDRTQTGSEAQSQTAEESTAGAADDVQLDVPLIPLGDPFFDGSQADTPVRMSLAFAPDGQPRDLVLAK